MPNGVLASSLSELFIALMILEGVLVLKFFIPRFKDNFHVLIFSTNNKKAIFTLYIHTNPNIIISNIFSSLTLFSPF